MKRTNTVLFIPRIARSVLCVLLALLIGGEPTLFRPQPQLITVTMDQTFQSQALAPRPWSRLVPFFSPIIQKIGSALKSNVDGASIGRHVWPSDAYHPKAASLLGVVVGFLSSLLGVGGGALIVPVLGWRFPVTPNQAAATSSAATVWIAGISAIGYQLKHPNTLDVAASASLIAGSFLGITLVGRYKLHDAWLKHILIFVVAVIGWKYLQLPLPFGSAPWLTTAAKTIHQSTWNLRMAQVSAGAVIGALSSMLGIGGGVLLVPLLNGVFGMSFSRAVATSLATIPLTSARSAWTRRWEVVKPIAHTIQAFAFIGAAIGFGATHYLSQSFLKQLFGGVLMLASGLFYLKREAPGTEHRPTQRSFAWGVVAGGLGVGVVLLTLLANPHHVFDQIPLLSNLHHVLASLGGGSHAPSVESIKVADVSRLVEWKNHWLQLHPHTPYPPGNDLLTFEGTARDIPRVARTLLEHLPRKFLSAHPAAWQVTTDERVLTQIIRSFQNASPNETHRILVPLTHPEKLVPFLQNVGNTFKAASISASGGPGAGISSLANTLLLFASILIGGLRSAFPPGKAIFSRAA